jgi:hypothetical protein
MLAKAGIVPLQLRAQLPPARSAADGFLEIHNDPSNRPPVVLHHLHRGHRSDYRSIVPRSGRFMMRSTQVEARMLRPWLLVLAVMSACSVEPLPDLSFGACHHPRFRWLPVPGVGPSPSAVDVADVNGDGILDIVVADTGTNMASVLVGRGHGAFDPRLDYATIDRPTDIHVADVTGDGIPDIVVGRELGQTVLIGTGNGTFREDFGRTAALSGVADRTTPGAALPSVSRDLDGDGVADLVVANPGEGTVTVKLGKPDGTYVDKPPEPVGFAPFAISVTDLDGDGKPELIFADPRGSLVSAVTGGPDGFLAELDYQTGKAPVALAVSDVNGDGKPDVVTANHDAATVSVLLGNGDDSLRPAVDYPTGAAPVAVVIADVDGDGKPDLVTANREAGTLSVLRGSGNGTFQSRVDVTVGMSPTAIAVADLNGDGAPDLAVANRGANTVSVVLADGHGGFRAAADLATGAWPVAIAIVDVNGDGHGDILVTNRGGNSVSVLLGDGDGSFRRRTDYPTALAPVSLAVKDIDRNGHLDLAVINHGINQLGGTGVMSVLFGNGDGTFPFTLDYDPGPPQSLQTTISADDQLDFVRTSFDPGIEKSSIEVDHCFP